MVSDKTWIDSRLLDLTDIFSEQLPRMDCRKILHKIRESSCASIVVTSGCHVIGGCTFKMHNDVSMIELLLLGVKSGLKN